MIIISVNKNNFLDIKTTAEIAHINGNPLSWFETIYSNANGQIEGIPWANLLPNPNLLLWINAQEDNYFKNKKALIIGCGLGDDAIALSKLGMDVYAFDISETCIKWCQNRFPNSDVRWFVYNLLELPNSWKNNFDLVVEVHILQAVHSKIRNKLAKALSPLVRQDGNLICIGRKRSENDTALNPSGPPWPLKKSWLKDQIKDLNLIDYQIIDNTNPDKIINMENQRYIAIFKKINNF